jgi:hypothetical protein
MAEEHTSVLSLIETMLEGRNNFFSNQGLRPIPFAYRPGVVARYMSNEALYIEFINRVYSNSIQTQAAATALVTLTMPNMLASFMDPVNIAPTQEQITSSLEDTASTTSSCAICQEAISSGASRIRQCGHVYHRACIVTWFSSSVRCPVCRHDIRTENPPAQTSSGEERTPFQPEGQ